VKANGVLSVELPAFGVSICKAKEIENKTKIVFIFTRSAAFQRLFEK
jgi:hypothetical protein